MSLCGCGGALGAGGGSLGGQARGLSLIKHGATPLPSRIGELPLLVWDLLRVITTPFLFALFFFVVLGLELRAYTWSHSTSPIFVFVR
jgi:hypothetical protein